MNFGVLIVVFTASFSIGRSAIKTDYSFSQRINFQIPRDVARSPCLQTSVVYGASGLGYWKKANYQRTGNSISLEIIPPTYLKETQFYLRCEDDKSPIISRLGSRHFLSSSAERISVREMMPMTSSLFLINKINGSKSWTEEEARVAILNRWGEIVWEDAGLKGNRNLRKPFSFTPLEGNKILIASRYDESFVRIVDLYRGAELEIDFQARRIPPLSHQFFYREETADLFYPSFICKELSRSQEFIPFFAGLKGLWRLLVLPRRAYVGGSLMSLNLRTGISKEIWNTFNNFSPDLNPSLFQGSIQTYGDPFMDVTTEEQYLYFVRRPRHLVQWSQVCHVDWTHFNSVDFQAGKGFLVSLRNINTIAGISEGGKMQWSMGEGKENTYSFPLGEQNFSAQHSAKFDRDNKIYLFDNNIPYRAGPGQRLQNRVMRIGLPVKPGLLEDVQTVEIPGAQSVIRGSVQRLKNGRYFAYLPGPPEAAERLLEIDLEGGTVNGELRVSQERINRGIEVLALERFGADEFLGLELNQSTIPMGRAQKIRQEVIDNSY